MVTVGMNYYVIEGKQDAFENAFRKVLSALEAAEGHLKSILYRDVDDSTSYLIISEWTDKSAFEGFIASPAFRAVADWGSQEILRGRPEHRIFGD